MSHKSNRGRLSLLKRKCIALPLQTENIFEMHCITSVESLDEKMTRDRNFEFVVVISSVMTPRDLLPVLANKPYAHRLVTVFILDKNISKYLINSIIYNDEITVGLSVNILTDGVWGTLMNSDIDVKPQNKHIDRLLYSPDESLEVTCTGININNFTLNEELDISEVQLNVADYSGYKGEERVMGVAQCDSNLTLTPDPIYSWKVPQGWTLEEAASVPVVYTLAYYCTLIKGQLEPGEDILVHAGMSPIGQAVIRVSLHIGANIITSVTSEKEATELLKLNPSLTRTQVFVLDTQDTLSAMEKAVARKGAHVVVNCLRGNRLTNMLKQMRHYCRFLHLANVENEDHETIGMKVFGNDLTIHGISLKNIIGSTDETKMMLYEALRTGLEEGVVKPLQMATFYCRDEANALLHLKSRNTVEKTILTSKRKNYLNSEGVEDFSFTKKQRVIILGTFTDLWMDVAEWSILRGACAIVTFTEEENNDQYNTTYRFIRLKNKFNTTKFLLLPKSRLQSIKESLIVIEEILQDGEIAAIFCLQQDENCVAMRNLDLASRKLVPDLRQFVSLMCDGAAVSESRARSGLPVYCVQSESPLLNNAHVLPYLSNLPADDPCKSKFFIVNDKRRVVKAQESFDFQEFLPTSLEELCQVGDSVSESPVFSEVVTRSPGHLHTCHSLLPVFMITGLGAQELQPLLQHIMYPAFCPSLPATPQSISEYAEGLLEDILKIQNQGPFNLVGSSWGGPVALALANLLDARGYNVKLYIMEGTSMSMVKRIKGLCESYGFDLGPSLLIATLKLPSKISQQVSQYQSWDDQLKVALHEANVQPDMQQRIARGLTCLYNQLHTLMNQEEQTQTFHGDLTLVTYKPVSPDHRKKLAQICEAPKVVSFDEDNYKAFLGNLSVATLINENVAFEWNL